MFVDILQQSKPVSRGPFAGIQPGPNTASAPDSSDACARCRGVEHTSAHVVLIAEMST